MNRKGFTLIEAILYISISSVVLLSVASIFAATVQSRARNQISSEVDQQGTFALRVIAQAATNAYTITIPGYGLSDTTLSLGSIITTRDPIVVTIVAQQLMFKEGSAAATALTSNNVAVTNVSFINVSQPGSPGAIRISLTITDVSSGAFEYKYQRTFTTTVSLRS